MATLVARDITGKNCYTQSIGFTSGRNLQSIAVDTLPAGTYLISMVLDGGAVHTVFVKE
jgi:hypothetical protein